MCCSKGIQGSKQKESCFVYQYSKMNLWLLLTFSALAECSSLKRSAPSCPLLCSCSSKQSQVVCSQSSLTSFPADGLSPNITQLSIQSTGVSSVTAHHLSTVPLLHKLQLYHNNLTSLPADLLKGVPHLTSLDLTGNRLVRLPPNVFSRGSLRNLVLKNNLIEEMDVEWFPVNGSLIWLDLSGNRLTSIPSGLHLKVPLLQILDLSDNNVQELQADALKNLHRLETLNLAGNKIISLQPATFAHTPKISKLFLQENRLKGLPTDLLQGLQRLELLLLNQNQLQNLPSGFLGERGSSFLVTLAGNPWVCDEKMEFLKKWLSVHPHSVLFLEEVTCAGPEALKHRQVVSVTDRELGLIQSEM